MWTLSLFILICSQTVLSLWDANVDCPTSCTCSLVHITETSIYGLKNRFWQKQTLTESDFHLNNEVVYDDNFDTELENFLLKSVTCLLQTETEPNKLLHSLPEDTESLRLIQGFESGNKTVRFSNFMKFEDLKIVELQGTNLFLGRNNDSFISLFDEVLPSLEYLNLENIHIKEFKHPKPFLEHKDDDGIMFEYTQQLHSQLHPLTFVQKGEKETKIVPYSKYKDEVIDLPVFVGFPNLQLLRVSNCKLNTIKWEMFEGLSKLQHLILEKNNIMFLPDFVFYGIPNLKSLSLAWNNLLSIQVTDLAGLLELEYLDVSHNNFSQLSELSLPPFPNLKLANFKNNPISAVFPSTFEVLNTTDYLVLGSTDTPMTLIANSFLGLKLLGRLTLENVLIPVLKKDLLFGMPNLKELDISGNISRIEYDAFLETYNLERLILSRCQIRNISMDAFMGLSKLRILDLSRNNLVYLPPNVFDTLVSLKELYLNENNFTSLPSGIFSKIHPKLIRLNQNPWHCSCHMSDWKPMTINKVKVKHLKVCDFSHDKNVACPYENRHVTKYIYDNRVAPKCVTPNKFKDWSVFHVMRKQLGCPEFRPKLKKKVYAEKNTNTTDDKIKDIKELYYLKKKPFDFNATKVTKPNTTNNISNTNADNSFSGNPLSEKMNIIPVKTQNQQDTNVKALESIYKDFPMKISLFHSQEVSDNNENNALNDLINNYNYYSKSNMLMSKSYPENKMLKSLERSPHLRKVKKYRRKGLRKTKHL